MPAIRRSLFKPLMRTATLFFRSKTMDSASIKNIFKKYSGSFTGFPMESRLQPGVSDSDFHFQKESLKHTMEKSVLKVFPESEAISSSGFLYLPCEPNSLFSMQEKLKVLVAEDDLQLGFI